MRCKVDIGLVQSRAKSISSNYEKPDCRLLKERAFGSLSTSDISKFFSECMCKSNANLYYGDCLSLIEAKNDSRDGYILTERFVNEILPYVSNTEYVSSRVQRSGILPTRKNDIKNMAESYKICDRILENHEKISKRFNIETYVESSRNKSLDRIVIKCCNMIDTYDLKPHAKMNICLEELSYLLQKQGISYKKSDLVKYVTEYFLTRSTDSSTEDFDKYKYVLSENSMIADSDLSSVSYFTELYDASKSLILQLLNRFTTSEKKNLYEDFGAIIRSMPIGFMISRDDFCTNFYQVLDYIKRYLLSETYDINEIIDILMTIPSNIEDQMNNEDWNYNRDQLDMITVHYSNAIEQIEVELTDCPDQELASKLIKLKDCYIESLKRIDILRGIVYTSYNIECMKEMVAFGESSANAIYFHEFKIFKFQNLIRATIEAEKFLKTKGKKLMDKIAGKLKGKKRKPIKETSIYEVITENNTADICVASFEILDESDFFEVHDTITSICKEMNETILRNCMSKAYYRVLTDCVEIRLEDVTPIIIEDADKEIIESTFTSDDITRCVSLFEMAELLESTDFNGFSNLVNTLESKISNIDYERFMSIIEASQFIDSIAEDDMSNLLSLYQESHLEDKYYKSSSIKNSISNWKHENAPLEIQVEAYNIICSLLESDEEKEKINKEKKNKENKEEKKSVIDKAKDKILNKDKDKKEDKKVKQDKPDESGKKDPRNPFSGVNLTSLKLYAQGLRAKMKDMSNKEKEWSKNIDMTFNRLYKSCKDALISDRREAIIKGSIIPSFSKCIKIGLAIAGVAAINPVAAAVMVIGGVAMSKNLTKKERILLLDEIDTELEVVEHEIEMAKSRNKTKKYRALLKYQKDLQRQSQRIKYNVRVGKDLLPGSTTGLKKFDD